MGFGRMLPTAKNPTRKEGFSRMFSSAAKNATRKDGYFGRMFSSNAGKSTINHKDDFHSERMKEIYGGIDYRKLSRAERNKIIDRRTKREVDIAALKAISLSAAIGLTVSSVYDYFAYGWYPFKMKQETSDFLQSLDSFQIHSASASWAKEKNERKVLIFL
ncbi:hypothetical protein MKX03_005632 [Papaver bracteatum]|nr:hypothetical protein MKX03_005632 [Papaver bracteatum]